MLLKQEVNYIYMQHFIACFLVEFETDEDEQESTEVPLSATGLGAPSARAVPEAGEVLLSVKSGIAVLEDLIATDMSLSLSKDGKMISSDSPWMSIMW